MLKTLTIFCLLVIHTAVFAQNAPSISVSVAGVGKVAIQVEQSGRAEGYNVFLNGNYLSTHRSSSGSNQFIVNGGSGTYCVSSFAFRDGSMRYSPCSAGVELKAENKKPSNPGNLRSSVYSNTAAELFWDASTDDGFVKSYEITRNAQVIATIDGRSYFESALEANRRYEYRVVAIDNEGSRSAAASHTLSTGGGASPSQPTPSTGGSPPSKPGQLRGTFYSQNAAEIFWEASIDNEGIQAYEVRRNNQVLSVLDGRSYFDSTVDRNNSYRYEVVAIDFSGNRSPAAQLTLGSGASAPVVNNDQPKQSGELKINLPNQRYTLNEGAQESLFIPFSIVRSAGNNREVNLSLRAEHPSSNAQLLHQFLPPKLSSYESGAILEVRLNVAVAPIDFQERRFMLVANDGNNVVETSIVFDVKPVNAPDIYLLAGQSNMEGSSELLAKDTRVGFADELNPRIKQLNVQPNSQNVFNQPWQFKDEGVNTSWPRYITAEDPLHEPRAPERSLKEARFIGMGLSFAKAALPNTTQEIYLVPAAWSATGFCAGENDGLSWNAKETPEWYLGGTLLADRALTRLNMTLRETGGIFRGILWHQGEADSNNPECANSYNENLKKLVARIRTEAMVDRRGSDGRGPNANIPFVVGSMSKGNDRRGSFEWFGTTKSLVDSAHRNIASNVPHAEFSNNDDLKPPAYRCGQGSCIHFGASAYRLMGFRYYEALRRIIGR